MGMNKLQELVDKASHIVVFSGAGFSTESGIPDFRSNDGLYAKKSYAFPVETILSHTFFSKHTNAFYDFYKKEMIRLDALPNKGHQALVSLEKQGKLEEVITQNIDGLHSFAGNTKVWELHGSVHRNYCMQCHQFYGVEKILSQEGVPICDTCGGIIKPDVVLYEEALDSAIVEGAVAALHKADLLIIAGTSLAVYPAAGLLQYYKGKDIVVINRDATSMDEKATLLYRENIGSVLSFIEI